MDSKAWLVAKLSDEQLTKLEEAERTLSAESISIVAFEPTDSRLANLNDSQKECLQGLENSLGLVLVAYKGTRPNAAA